MNQKIEQQKILMEKALDLLQRIVDVKFFFESIDKKYSDERCAELQNDYADVMALLFENLATVEQVTLIERIQAALQDTNAIVGLSILDAIRNRVPDRDILHNIYTNILKSEEAMRNMLSDSIVNDIKAECEPF